jgi:hypothetical protein
MKTRRSIGLKERQMANGKWKMENGKWKIDN